MKQSITPFIKKLNVLAKLQLTKSLLAKFLIILISVWGFTNCIDKNIDEPDEEITISNLVVSDPSIWNTLATQSISLEDLGEKSALLSSDEQLKEHPGGNMYYYAIFEDLFPGEGDYDFNDVVLKTKLFLGSDNDNYSGRLETDFVHQGGNIVVEIGLMIYETDKGMYKRIPNEDIIINEQPLSSNGLPYTFALEGDIAANNNWEIEFSFKKGDMKDIWINYFIVTEHAGEKHKILTAGFADMNETGQFEIPQTAYLTNDNKPWGLEIEADEMPIVKEKENFCKAFPDFVNWINDSTDKKYKKWYENPDNAFIQAVK